MPTTMQRANTTPLVVFKASAGSGKTFTLAVEYISLLVQDPDNYSRILAVTFTNKATEEMKMRIISQLYGLAQGLAGSQPYLDKVTEKTGYDARVVKERAQVALTQLIHHYSYFRVQTIDAFFQRVLRNLAHELDLTANLRVSLNDNDVEEEAVDDMINSLQEGDKKLGWIRDYINDSIDDDKSWNVISQIKSFGRNIFNDVYKDHEKEMDRIFASEEFFTRYTGRLRGMVKTNKEAIVSAYTEVLNVIQDNGLDDFDLYPYGRRGSVLSYIKRQSEGYFNGSPTSSRIEGCLGDARKWAKKGTSSTQEIINLAENTLINLLKKAEKERLSRWNDYQSALLVLRHINELRLLRSISDAVKEVNKDANRFQLSDTQSLLKAFMKDTDTPFVFEKMGAYLLHMMIDEFQDTSTVQWNNFKLLLDNCLAQAGSHSLIVGDVKQSIYRWRQGDWTLLNGIDKKFDKSVITVKPLDVNYRSEQNIVEFNNIFFKLAADYEMQQLIDQGIPDAEQLQRAYDDVEQLPNKKNGKGSVTIKLLPSEGYADEMLNQLIGQVKEMIESGIKPDAIAILIRANKEIPVIADAFLSHNITDNEGNAVKLVSDEAFRLDASLAVNTIVAAIRLLCHPEDNLTRATLVKNYRMNILNEDVAETQLLLDEAWTHVPTDDELAAYLDTMLPPDYAGQRDKLAALPLVDLVSKLATIFNVEKLEKQHAYLCAFFDQLDEYVLDNTASLDGFLNYWDETLFQKTIQTDEVNGIRLISIHKSKGLEFDNVIVPYCDWQLENSRSMIWCDKKQQEPFNQLPLLPIDFSKSSMEGTVFEEDYQREHLQCTVDNLNLLYVAFTRPKKNLVVIGKRRSKNSKNTANPASNRSDTIEHCLQELSNKLPESTLTGVDSDSECITFTFGNLLTDSKKKDDEQSENIFEVKPTPVNLESFPMLSNHVDFKQSTKSRELAEPEEEAADSTDKYLLLGNVLHQLFATIRTTEDIEPKLRQLQADGVLYNADISSEDVDKAIRKSLTNPIAAEWFKPGWRLFNECTILQRGSDSSTIIQHRPDRVMTDGKRMIVVDFKFGQPRHEHQVQVREYMTLLGNMGYQNIYGYIWYVLRNDIREVKL